MQPDYYAFLGMPGYGEVTAAAARAFSRASRQDDKRISHQYNEGSLLASNFNRLWVSALNAVRMGKCIEYFAMQHADIAPQDWWLDRLVAELEANDLDMLGVVAPIKDSHGLTSIALDRPDGDTWRPLSRLTMAEVRSLPPTFTSANVGHPLLLNTGLWVCRFDPRWVSKVHFEINDRIVQTPDGEYHAQVEPEDWFFSRLCHELGLRIGATRKIRLDHRGSVDFPNDRVWGEAIDSSYTRTSPLPIDPAGAGFRFPREVAGWLSYDEGKALYDLARDRRVLEIGSFCGRSTICLAQAASHVTAVDYFDGRATPDVRDTLAEFWANLKRYDVDSHVITESPDAPPAGTFDFVFIDGAHDYASVKADIAKALAGLAPEGLIAFHDLRSGPGACDGGWDPGVNRAVQEFLGQGAEMVSIHDSLAVVKPPALASLEF